MARAQAVRIHDRGRTMYRSARRLAAGAIGLSPRVTAAWLLDRARRHAGTDTGNSSLTWVTASSDETTWLWLHNYWSDAYGIDRPRFAASLLNTDGTTVASWELALEPDATARIDVRQVCLDHGVRLPFEGQALLHIEDDRLAAGRPVQLLAEYVQDDGEASAVHGQYGLQPNPLAQRVGSSRVDPRPGLRTGVVVSNTYGGPGSPRSAQPRLEVLAADGRRRHATLDRLPAGGMRRVYLDDEIPDLREFLQAAPGQLRVQLPCPSSRQATFVEIPAERRRIVNHATIDRSFDQGPGLPAGSPVVPVTCVVASLTAGLDTVICLPNTWGPEAATYRAELRVHRTDGSEVTRRIIEVARRATVDVSVGDLVTAAGESLPADVLVEVRVVGGTRRGNPIDVLPATVDVVVGLRDGEHLVGEAQVGSSFFNADVPAGLPLRDVKRTRVFTRVRTSGGSETTILLGHPRADDRPADPARPKITLLDPTGTRASSTELEIAAHGCLSFRVTDLFPDAAEVLGAGGIGTLRVRDTGARLYGFHLTPTVGTRNVAIDHLVGG